MKALLLGLPLVFGLLLTKAAYPMAIFLQDATGWLPAGDITLIASQGIGLLLVIWFIWPSKGGWAQMMEVQREATRSHHDDNAVIQARLDAITVCTETNRQILSNVQTQLSTRPCINNEKCEK